MKHPERSAAAPSTSASVPLTLHSASAQDTPPRVVEGGGWRKSSYYWLVVAATLWAAFSRFYHLQTLPPQAWVDEIWFGLRARELLQTGQLQLFYKTTWGGGHPLFVQLTALAQLLGLNHVIVASRAVSAVSSLLCIPLAFVCFDELWREAWPRERRRLLAALAAIVLSNLFFFVVASRVGTEPALSPLAALFCVWQIHRARRTGHWAGWVWAGLAAGLAQYVSPHARFVLPLVGFIALHELIRSPARQRKFIFLGFSLLGLTAVLVALPLILFFIREPAWFFARAANVIPRGSGLAFVLDNARLIWLSLGTSGDLDARHNLPGRPIFDWIQGLGFWIGVAWALFRFRRSASARELLAWSVIMIAPSLITDGAPQFERMIGFAPAAAALIALGWVELWTLMRQRINPTGIVTGAGIALVGLSLALNTYDYFVRYPTTPDLATALTTTPVNLAQQLIARAPTEPVFVERLTESEDVFAFDFLFPGTSVQRLDFRQCLPLVNQRLTRTTYLVLEPETTQTLTQTFPSASVTRIHPEAASLMRDAALIEIPPGARLPARTHSVQAQFSPGLTLLGYDWSGPNVKAGESVFLTLYWQAETDIHSDLTAFMHVETGRPDSPLLTQHDGQPCQGFYPTSRWRAGDVVPDGFAVTIPSEASPGEYPLAVGWYTYPALERLPLISADMPLSDNRAVIGTLIIGD